MATVQKSQPQKPLQERDARSAPAATPATQSAQRIAERAYQLWQASGCTHGHDKDHWFQAERELRGPTH